MKERIAQLKARYQHYSAREKVILKICAASMCCAVVYYAGVIPLDNMIQGSKQRLGTPERNAELDAYGNR